MWILCRHVVGQLECEYKPTHLYNVYGVNQRHPIVLLFALNLFEGPPIGFAHVLQQRTRCANGGLTVSFCSRGLHVPTVHHMHVHTPQMHSECHLKQVEKYCHYLLLLFLAILTGSLTN